jgi:hypothetical protein
MSILKPRLRIVEMIPARVARLRLSTLPDAMRYICGRLTPTSFANSVRVGTGWPSSSKVARNVRNLIIILAIPSFYIFKRDKSQFSDTLKSISPRIDVVNMALLYN